MSSVWRFYDRHEITFKKVLHAVEQDRPDVADARAEASFPEDVKAPVQYDARICAFSADPRALIRSLRTA